MPPGGEVLILASASAARAELLRSAGLAFVIEPAAIDEASVKRVVFGRGDSALDCAMTLAAEKAVTVSRRQPGALVIGADQVLAIGREWFDKPSDEADARAQLRCLRGRIHCLATAVCVAQDGAVVWRAESVPELSMRDFSESFLAAYVAAEGDALLGSVGCYRFEGRGVQLFERIVGDYFAILGLPLLELLRFLRIRGHIPR